MAGTVRLVNPDTGSVVEVAEEKADRLKLSYGLEAEKPKRAAKKAASSESDK